MADLGALSRRVLDTLSRDTALKSAVRTFRWGNAPIFDYAGAKPLVFVAPSISPVERADIGSGGDPDLHAPQVVRAAIEVILATESQASAERAQEQAWALARLAEAAIGANPRLLDADGGDAMAASTRISTYSRRGPNVGGPVEALTVLLRVTTYDWPGAPASFIRAEPEAVA